MELIAPIAAAPDKLFVDANEQPISHERMKRWQFILLLLVGLACLGLTLVSIVFARENQKLQADVQAQQILINKGALSQQAGANILREMALAAQTDDRMKQLLKNNGYDLSSISGGSTAPTP